MPNQTSSESTPLNQDAQGSEQQQQQQQQSQSQNSSWLNTLLLNAGSALVTVIGGGLLLYHYVLPATPFVTPFDSLACAVRLLAISALILLAYIQRIAFYRLLTPSQLDPSQTDSRPDRQILLLSRILQNTLEQYVLHAAAVLSVSTYVADARVPVILCLTFVWGRIAFSIGYSRSAKGRAYGYAVTVFPTIFALSYVFYKVITGGLGASIV